MTGFTAPTRKLPYPIDRAVQLVVTTPEGEETCGLPAFPEDSDERITVLFRLSLNEFVALASAVDAGIDPAYGADAQKVWWIWVASVMCASFCEEMALCLTDEDPAVVEALATILQNNSTIINAIAQGQQSLNVPQPGVPVSQQQAERDRLPENVKDGETCLNDQLWGASLYIIQSANRAITDVFEVLEAASNALERGDIALDAIPAVGESLSTVVSFADQLAEEIAEGYAASYTEAYEEQLACSVFCTAQEFCSINVDQIISILVHRFDPGTFDVSDFASVMNGVITGSFVGDAIADAAMLVYFTALKFGQQFGGVLGLHSITQQASLGADVLASDNWETLCDCGWESVLDFTVSDYGFVVGVTGDYTASVGFEDTYGAVGGGYRGVNLSLDFALPANITYAEMTFEYEPGLLEESGDYTAAVYSEIPEFLISVLTPVEPVSPESGDGDLTFNTINVQLLCGIRLGETPSDPGGSCILTQLVLRGFGDKPSELP